MTAAWSLPDGFEIARSVRSRAVTAVEVIKTALDRIREGDQVINAFTVVLEEQAIATAASIDARIRAGQPVGSLCGVPVAVKDHIWISGTPATNGSLALRDFIPPEECVAVSRLRAADAVIVGKTNNPEFCYAGTTANPLWGTTRNPWNTDRTPGGSSGGSAAAVAAGMIPISLGTDAGGSIRIPAAFCGVIGMKPTFGLVPARPGFKGWKSLSVIGPLTRSVRDAALSLAVMGGPDPADDTCYPLPTNDLVSAALRQQDLSGLRVAYSVDLGYAPVESQISRAFEEAVALIGSTGCKLREDHPTAGDPTRLHSFLAACEGFASEGQLVNDHENLLTPGLARLIRSGNRPAHEYIEAIHQRALYSRAWAEFFVGVDLLVTPMMPLTAFDIAMERPTQIGGVPLDDELDDWCSLCYPANLTNQPAVSVPIAVADDSLPIGMQIIGRRFEDDVVLRAAAFVERLVSWPPVGTVTQPEVRMPPAVGGER